MNEMKVKTEKIKELIHKEKLKAKEIFQYNDLREELAGIQNPNKEIASNLLKAQIKRRNEQERVIKNAKQEIKDIENKKSTRGTTKERAQRIVTLNKGIEVIKNKMAVRNVGRPRKSNAMSELEKQVSGQLLSA